VRQQIAVRVAASYLPKEIDVTNRRRQSKIQAVVDCFDIPYERQTHWGIT
jgi:hypothetical protein